MRMRKKKNSVSRLTECNELLLNSREEIDSFPITVEIGCGKGRFILETAKRNPGINYIAIEKISDVALMAMEKVRDAGLTNVKFIIGDALSLPEFFRENELERIYLNFSDPWPKSGHTRRRLTYRGFLEMYKGLLSPNGEIVFKTDNRPLFDFSVEEFKYMGFDLEDLTYDLHNSEYAKDNIVTEYEANFSAKGFSINRVRAKMSRITNLDIKKAELSHLDRIMEIVAQAQKYMHDAGFCQWDNGYPSRELIRKDIEEGNRYIVCEGDTVMASAGLFMGEEPDYNEIYEGEWLNSSPYISIHRICVDNSFKGIGLGGAIVRRCEDIARKNNIRNIRCDTHEKNLAMRRMLEKNGFVYCGIIHLADGSPRVAYQKKMK
ncbi:MAG: tRNA (guanosine(46)-N7)-methyltransferase TrmB [Ruminococcaceae bacterium]|nr:tRNA (guanosine(46)-N7)-methyltransferase TrmB [Oscillospiraceae bacterium]